MTTIQKPHGSYTESLEETMQVILDHHIAVDNKRDDNEHNKDIRKQIREPVKTDDDRELTLAEVMKSSKKQRTKRHQGRWYNRKNLQEGVQNFSHTDIHNLQIMLKNRMLPKKWKISKMIPKPKPGRENIHDASK